MNQSDPNLIKSLKHILYAFEECAILEDDLHLDALSRHIDELEAAAAQKSLFNPKRPGGS